MGDRGLVVIGRVLEHIGNFAFVELGEWARVIFKSKLMTQIMHC